MIRAISLLHHFLPYFLISKFLFPISYFLVPTFRGTPGGGGVAQGHANIRLLSQHLFCYWDLHRNSESSSSDLKAV